MVYLEKIREIVKTYKVVLVPVLEKVRSELQPQAIRYLMAHKWFLLLARVKGETIVASRNVIFNFACYVRPVDALSGSPQRGFYSLVRRMQIFNNFFPEIFWDNDSLPAKSESSRTTNSSQYVGVRSYGRRHAVFVLRPPSSNVLLQGL